MFSTLVHGCRYRVRPLRLIPMEYRRMVSLRGRPLSPVRSTRFNKYRSSTVMPVQRLLGVVLAAMVEGSWSRTETGQIATNPLHI